jgi:drug/metabolite transporter (DMT)-like permease
MTTAVQGQVLALGTAFCWTISAIMFEAAGRRVGSIAVNLIRLLMAAALLVALNTVRRGMPFPSDAPAHTWFWLTLSGIVGFFIGDLALFRAYLLIGARLSTLIMSLAPVVAAVLGLVALGERIGPLGWTGMTITLGGIAWVLSERRPSVEESHRVSRVGVLLAVIGAAAQAVGLVLGKHGMEISPGEQYDPFAATLIRAIAGIVGFAIVISAAGLVDKTAAALRDRRAMTLMLAGAIAGPFLGVSLLLAAVQRVPSGVAQTIVATIPVLILPFAIFVKKERVSWRAGLGAAVTVAGVAVLMLA